jgi:hypothetical protein
MGKALGLAASADYNAERLEREDDMESLTLA